MDINNPNIIKAHFSLHFPPLGPQIKMDEL
jgi:hypothetical protein